MCEKRHAMRFTRKLTLNHSRNLFYLDTINYSSVFLTRLLRTNDAVKYAAGHWSKRSTHRGKIINKNYGMNWIFLFFDDKCTLQSRMQLPSLKPRRAELNNERQQRKCNNWLLRMLGRLLFDASASFFQLIQTSIFSPFYCVCIGRRCVSSPSFASSNDMIMALEQVHIFITWLIFVCAVCFAELRSSDMSGFDFFIIAVFKILYVCMWFIMIIIWY